jgi:hypothetical protein
VLDRGGTIFKQTAPIIKLSTNATEDDHYALLAYLNSSTACFWMKQVCFPKGTTTGDISKEKGREDANRYAFSGTALQPLPLPPLDATLTEALQKLGAQAFRAGVERGGLNGSSIVEDVARGAGLENSLARAAHLERELVALQEEIDWLVYAAFGLCAPYAPSGVAMAEKEQRPFLMQAADSLPAWVRRSAMCANSRRSPSSKGQTTSDRGWGGAASSDTTRRRCATMRSQPAAPTSKVRPRNCYAVGPRLLHSVNSPSIC